MQDIFPVWCETGSSRRGGGGVVCGVLPDFCRLPESTLAKRGIKYIFINDGRLNVYTRLMKWKRDEPGC